jgi:phosphoribosylanthranilate isomerase
MSERTRIKICGIRDFESAAWALQAGTDAIGLVFVASSPRCVDVGTAAQIACSLPPFAQSVVLTADMAPGRAVKIAEQVGADWLQVHGQESEEQLEELCLPIVRGFQFSPEAVRRWNVCDAVDALLVDGSSGGQGETFDWDQLAELMDEIDKPVLLAGGLTPENVGAAITAIRPWAVDVSSGVEKRRGVKDEALIHEFCQAVREADRQ